MTEAGDRLKTPANSVNTGDGTRSQSLNRRSSIKYTTVDTHILSVISLALKLLTNTIQVYINAVMRSILRVRAVAILLGDGRSGKLPVDGFEHRIDPLGSALLACSTWDEGISLLGCLPEEGLDSILGSSLVSAACCYQYQCREINTGQMSIPRHIQGVGRQVQRCLEWA